MPEDSSSFGDIHPRRARLQYGANDIHDVKEQANLDLRFPNADERSVRSRCVVRRLSRVAVFAGMAGAADTHSWVKAQGTDRTRDSPDTVKPTHLVGVEPSLRVGYPSETRTGRGEKGTLLH